MTMEFNHLREVGVSAYPNVAPRVSPPTCVAAPAVATAEKKGTGNASAHAAPSGKKGQGSPAAEAAPAANSKEKPGKAAKEAKATPPAPSGPPPAEKTEAELAKMSKEERTQYHQARRSAQQAGSKADDAAAGNATATAQLTKAQRRAVQESQRKVKDDKVSAAKEGDEVFEELKMQGLSEDQARAVMAEITNGEALIEDDEDEDEEADDLLSSVQRWMAEQDEGEIPEEAIRDFNMKVRFQGHVNTTPPDHIEAMLRVLVDQVLSACDLTAAKIQPGSVAKALGPVLERWAHILRGLYSKIPDVLEAIEVVVRAVSESVAATGAPAHGQDCGVVGCLMAVRELDDLVDDEDLLVGCKGVEPRSRVLDKFIEFLEDALDDEDDEEDDG